MARVSAQDLLHRVLEGIGTPTDYISAVVDRTSGRFEDAESKYMDLKEKIDPWDERCVAETSRDILAFSNTSGGLLVAGVTDSRMVVGHAPIDGHVLREKLGAYFGTFVDCEIGSASVNILGRETSLAYILIPRCTRTHPNLLRKDIPLRGGAGPKLKYLRGSLFFREENCTRVEPTGGDIESRAAELEFRAPNPRAGTPFLLDEDKPGIRVYAHINNKFFGRQRELNELLSRFDDPRGRGISIAGMGGIGKTELAIEIVKRCRDSRRFSTIYSGSAKRNLFSSGGTQETDPCFFDYPGLLRDLGAWMGLDFQTQTTLDQMRSECLSHLAEMPRTLLFVDNLETVQDQRVFNFLDDQIPKNVWLLTTSRVHKVKNYLYTKQLDFMLPSDAAHLLRHELKRQGIKEYADMPIDVLEARAIQLQRHPLMIRWYAWSCKRTPQSWDTVPRTPAKSDVESFCIGQTLQSLPLSAQRVLSAISAIEEKSEATPECLAHVAGVADAELDVAFYDLESAGLVYVAVDPQTGQVSYTTNPMANGPARELARKNDWENEFARGFRNYLAASGGDSPADPLVRSLIEYDPTLIRSLTADQIRDLTTRLDRVLARPHSHHTQLLALSAECERHTGRLLSADKLYEQAAREILSSQKAIDSKSARILLEAATVARKAFQTEPQLKRAISYLAAIQHYDVAPLRVFGMLVEMSARLPDKTAYENYYQKAMNIRTAEKGRFTATQLAEFDEAITRARALRKN